MYAMVVMVDEKYLVEPKVCCDCPYIGLDEDGFLACGINWKRVPDGINTEKAENEQCPVVLVESVKSFQDFSKKHHFSFDNGAAGVTIRPR